VTLGLLAGSVILLLVFLRIERVVPAPMLDLSLFRQRTFSAAAGSALLNYVCVYTMIFLLPFYLLQARGLSTAQAGLLLTAEPLTMAVVAPLSGALSDRIGTRLPSVIGMSLLAVALWLLSGLTAETPAWVFVLKLGLAGLGIGIFASPNNSALMGSAPANRQGIAAGTLALARNVGMVLGVAFAGAVYTIVLGHSAGGDGTAILEATRIAYMAAAGIALVGMGIAALRA
jgi:MFS family permease